MSPTTPDAKGDLPDVEWRVREDGNLVILEFKCRDNYEAIELAEVIGEGMRSGSLEIEFQGPATKPRRLEKPKPAARPTSKGPAREPESFLTRWTRVIKESRRTR